MPDNVVQLYNTLTTQAQEEVYDFMMYLVQKEEKNVFQSDAKDEQKKRLAALYEFAGSGKHLWNGIDALAYQQKLREERVVG